MKKFFQELRRRKVIRAGLTYAVVGWLLIQVAQATFGPLKLPEWSLTLFVVLVIAGFPLVLILAWGFELGRSGLKRDPRAGATSPSSDEHRQTDTQPRSIAVLPFVDMSPERDQAYFCEGVAEEILNALTRIHGLRVASRTASFQFHNQAVDMPDIGRRLNVSNLLEGSVRKAGDRLRITAQLIDVASGYHLWSERFDSHTADIFDIQDEIARRVADALQLTAISTPKAARTSDPDAYDYALRGWKYFHGFGARNLEFAQRMFRKAIKIDPEFSRAWAGLADTAAFLYLYYGARDEYRQEAMSASERALAICNTIAETHASRGLAYMINKEFNKADTCFRKAIEINPSLFEPYYFYARSLVHQGKMEQAAQFYEKAHEVDPEDYQTPLLVRQVYQQLNQPAKADHWSRLGVEAARRRLELQPDDVRAMYLSAIALFDLGLREEGLSLADRALELQPDETAVQYNVACTYIRAGLHDKALDLLEKVVDKGMSNRQWVDHDPDLDPLRGNPRFEEILSRLP